MSADTQLEERDVSRSDGSGLGEVDEPTFSGLADRHRLLDELPAADADGPETVAVARETIELACLVAVKHLAP